MANIFKNILNKETLVEVLSKYNIFKNLFRFFKSKRILVRAGSLFLVGIFSIVISIVSVGITFGFDVKYAGRIIATIKEATVFDDAKNIAVKNINSSNADNAIKTPKFSLTLTVADRLDNAVKVADAIIENTDEIVSGSALKINGEIVACVDAEGLERYIESSRTRFYVEGAENTANFTDDVKVESGYYLESEIEDIENVKIIIDNLPVKTVTTVYSEVEIPYTSSTEKTAKQLIGYKKVTTAGECGVRRVCQMIETLNGAEASRTEISNEVIKEPVNEVVTVGTAKSTATANQKAAATSAGFICPLNKGSYCVSAYYGDGRNHKGIDLAADKGTSIFAAAAGTVSFSGYDGNYGYSVIIDHGNGMKTRYAHASALCVQKGATVSQGELIALVGRTGYSTGNHLHFEVIVNGKSVNPAPYIGLD